MLKGYIWTVFNIALMKSLKEINRFVLVFLAIYLPFIIADKLLGPEIGWIGKLLEYVYHIILKFVMFGSVGVLKLFGYDVVHTYDIIGIKGARSLFIGHVCLALDLMVMYAALIIAYPGNKKSKWFVIPIGLLIIQLVNIMRICILAVTLVKHPENFEFEHHTVFTIVVYGVFFIIWVLWLKYFPADEKESSR